MVEGEDVPVGRVAAEWREVELIAAPVAEHVLVVPLDRGGVGLVWSVGVVELLGLVSVGVVLDAQKDVDGVHGADAAVLAAAKFGGGGLWIEAVDRGLAVHFARLTVASWLGGREEMRVLLLVAIGFGLGVQFGQTLEEGVIVAVGRLLGNGSHKGSFGRLGSIWSGFHFCGNVSEWTHDKVEMRKQQT